MAEVDKQVFRLWAICNRVRYPSALRPHPLMELVGHRLGPSLAYPPLILTHQIFELTLDLTEPADILQRLLGQLALARGMRFKELAPGTFEITFEQLRCLPYNS
jgi:hypothetical protein